MEKGKRPLLREESKAAAKIFWEAKLLSRRSSSIALSESESELFEANKDLDEAMMYVQKLVRQLRSVKRFDDLKE